MSAFNIKSEALKNRDASPTVITNPTISKGNLKEAFGVANTSDYGSDIGAAGTQLRLISLPSNARISRLEYARADIATSSMDVAAWYPTNIPQGGANAPAASLAATLISSSAFKTAIAGLDGGDAWTDAMSASTPTIAARSYPLWQLLGLSSDPEIDIDLGFTVRTAVNTNGYVGLYAQYTE